MIRAVSKGHAASDSKQTKGRFTQKNLPRAWRGKSISMHFYWGEEKVLKFQMVIMQIILNKQAGKFPFAHIYFLENKPLFVQTVSTGWYIMTDICAFPNH